MPGEHAYDAVGTDDYRMQQPLNTTFPPEQNEPTPRMASVEDRKRLWWKNATINSVFIACWFTFATLLSLYNKWMFTTGPDKFGFGWPMFVTTLHMFVQFALAAFLRFTWPARFCPENRPSRGDYAKKALPTGLATGLDIGLSNFSLKLITLSFYTMCKSSSLIFVLLFAFLFRLEQFSWRLIGVITLIFSGVLLMVATETHFELLGLVLVLSASALGGLRWSLTQLLLKNREMGMDNPAATVYWLSPIMGISLCIVSLFIESWSDIFKSHFFDGFWRSMLTMGYLVTPGIIAFCMVISEFYIIQRAGVVPMSIAGIAKEVSTITLAAWVFGDELTPLNITGVAITVCGIALFTYHKYRKAVDSPVPLDAHGNPISDEEASSAGYIELATEQTTQRRPSRDEEDTMLFSVGDEDEEEFDSGRHSNDRLSRRD